MQPDALDLSPTVIALLVTVAFVAGLVDAIAGGGGLLTLPSLLAAGLEPHFALGTNKGQSVFGSGAALLRFGRAGRVDLKLARLTFPLGLVGSLMGAALVLLVSPTVLRPLVLVMLIGAAVFVLLRSPASTKPILAAPPPWVAPLLAFIIGTYDGFFGPGTGTFLIVGLVALLGRSLTHASADAKVVNFASNLAAVALFGARGFILWKIALPMGVAQLLGATLGAHLTVKVGDKLVKRVVLAVVLALTVKVARDFVDG